MPVARRLRNQLALLPVDLVVDEHGRLRRVPVVRIVRGGLEMPDHLARVGIHRDDRPGEEVVSRPILVRDDGLGIAGRDVDVVELRIVGDRLPCHAAAMPGHFLVRPGLHAGVTRVHRHRIPAPLHRAAFGMMGLDVPRDVEIVAADADDETVLQAVGATDA